MNIVFITKRLKHLPTTRMVLFAVNVLHKVVKVMKQRKKQNEFGTGGQTMRKQELKFMNELLVKLMVASDDKLFLLNALAGVSYDIASLEKNGVIRPEIESIKKILDDVYNHFGRADNDR